MAELWNTLYTLWNQIFYAVSNISVFDVIDIAIVSFVLYKSFKFLKESRGGQLAKGFGILVFVYAVSYWFNLSTVHWALSKLANWSIIALAIIFQPELRSALEKIGRSGLSKIGHAQPQDGEVVRRTIDNVCLAADSMHEKKIGALIVFERTTQLGEIIDTGTLLDAKVSSQLVGNVFYPKSPLHDGAMIIRGDRMVAAGCVLPLTSNPNLSSQLGTRHRAAMGVSEVSDSVIIVVSEETGMISLVQNGKIERGFDQIRLREALYELLIEDEDGDGKDNMFSRIFPVTNKIGSVFSKHKEEEQK